MKLEELAAMIQQRLAEFTAGTDPRLSDQRALAVSLQALPIYADIGGCMALRLDGELISIHGNQDWMKHVEWEVERDPKWRTAALVSAAGKYPEFSVLLPPRPDDATTCPPCSGDGRIAASICGQCSGLGYVRRA